MKCSIWYDEQWELEMTPAYVQHNPTLCKSTEVKSETFEYCLNCSLEERRKIIQNILNNNIWNK